MEKIFNDYFNNRLKLHLRYPETFNIQVYEDRVVLNPNQNSQLLDIIKNNPNIKEQLIKLVTSTLEKYLEGIREVYITTNGTNITFMIEYESLFQLKKIPEIGIYTNIAAGLDLKSLNELCRTDKKFNKMCIKNIFLDWCTFPEVSPIFDKSR